MFILMGETEKVYPPKTGEFFCPVCQGNHTYTHHHSVAYFTLFGIKVASLNTLSDYLSCNECANCFSPQVLSAPEKHDKAINHQIMFRVLTYLLSGYGDTAQSRNRVLSIFESMTGQTLTKADVENELAIVTSGQAPTLPFLKENTFTFSPLQKQQLIIAAYKFVEGSCLMEHHDRVRINTIGSSIGLSLPEIEYLIVNNQ